jgi:hypothetical protein
MAPEHHHPHRSRLPGRSKTHRVLTILIFSCVIVGLFLVSVVVDNLGLDSKPVVLGATFSKSYAESLGLDWKQTYLAMFDEIHVPEIRLPVYWNDVERERDKFTYDDVDWQVREAAKRGVKIVLGIGRKQPRWPECHVPEWARKLDEPGQRAEIIAYIDRSVRRYAKYDNIVAWQVENEPFFDFGQCPPPDRDFLKREIATVKAIDTRPVVVSESGELSTWTSGASVADVLGISMYRVVWDKRVGFLFWPLTPKYYRSRAQVVSPFVSKIIITELQAEPWANQGILNLPISEQLHLMDPQRLRDNVLFARRIGFPEVYLWGVEWWYWLKTRGHSEMWDTARDLYAESVKPL